MAEKFIGAQIRAGQFEAKDTGKKIDYNNLVLYTSTAAEVGEVANDPVKIANTAQNIISVFGEPITMKWLKDRLGMYIIVFYNKYKKPERVMFLKDNPDSVPAGYTGLQPAGEGISDYTHAEPASAGLSTADDTAETGDFLEEFTDKPDDKKGGKK